MNSATLAGDILYNKALDTDVLRCCALRVSFALLAACDSSSRAA